MEYRVLWRAGLRRHRGGLVGIFVLMLLVSLALGSVLSVWSNSSRYVNGELDRAGFGSLTAWVSDLPDTAPLEAELEAMPQVTQVESQRLIFSNYEIREQESDSEGQLLVYAPKENRYRFFSDDMAGYVDAPSDITPGTVYVSPSLVSMFDVELGDEVIFPIARAGGNMILTVAGFYEDPFMGSSMIGMKGFLVSQEDYAVAVDMIQGSGIDALGRPGAMLHIYGEPGLALPELNRAVNEGSSLPQFTEFIHSREAISGFMLILQNAFSALLLAFVLVLLCAVFVVLGHSITSTIQADYKNMGSLKTVGITTSALRRVQLLQYGTAILPGVALGLTLAPAASRLIASATLTTTGLSIPSGLPVLWTLGAFGAILVLLALYISGKARKIGSITPMKALRGELNAAAAKTSGLPKLNGKSLSLSLALRQLLTGKRNYIGACAVALLLVFFASLVGRMDGWLGPDGKGMMDAFNPADHDLGVQTFGTLDEAEAEQLVLSYTDILDHYVLAMPGVAVNGVDYTANVIDEPERFHILEGRTCVEPNEIVLTEFVAADLGVGIGDAVTVSSSEGSEKYTVTGIYSCANDMGDNVGMNRDGYLKVGWDDPQIWCHHYFLADPTLKPEITQTLESTYGGDVHVHENTWPGLTGIIAAMRALVTFMYAMVVIFVLIVTAMTSGKLLLAEQRDIGIYKAVGLRVRQLRFSFALRFAMTAIVGGALGTVLAGILTDPLVSAVMKLAGISNFASHPGLGSTLIPIAVVTLLFALFAYLAAGKLKRTDLTVLISE